jgi:hypothetical protein
VEGDAEEARRLGAHAAGERIPRPNEVLIAIDTAGIGWDASFRDGSWQRPRSGGISEARDTMTKQVLLIQGGGEGTHEEWDNKILESLERELGPDYIICYPRVARSGHPVLAHHSRSCEPTL